MTSLPDEVILAIADNIKDRDDLIRFSIACMLPVRKWQHLTIDFENTDDDRASEAVLLDRFRTSAKIRCTWPGDRVSMRGCGTPMCHSCKLKMALSSLDQFLALRSDCFSYGLEELIFNNGLRRDVSSCSNNTTGAHTLYRAGGLKALRPRRINMRGMAGWDPLVLRAFDLPGLLSLEISLHHKEDYIVIAELFSQMPRLQDLKIAVVSDADGFVGEYHHLGLGILALKSSLRSLCIRIIDKKCEEWWEDNGTFRKPEDPMHFFDHIFSQLIPTKQEIESARKEESHDPGLFPYRSIKGPLNLTTLSLINVGLPSHAFFTVFNPFTVQNLDILQSEVAEAVWTDLIRADAQLHTLTQVDYDLLCTPFLTFLASQHELRELTFARPADLYGLDSRGEKLVVTQRAPLLGLGTAFGKAEALAGIPEETRDNYRDLYPSSAEFVNALGGCRHTLKQLKFPPCMFDVSAKFMLQLATQLSGLESIEWGFDYTDETLQQVFLNEFLPQLRHLKKITFFPSERPAPVPAYNTANFFHLFLAQPHIASRIPPSLRHVRCLLPDYTHPMFNLCHDGKQTYYHWQNPVDGEWWKKLRESEGEWMHDHDLTPCIFPVEDDNTEHILEAIYAQHEGDGEEEKSEDGKPEEGEPEEGKTEDGE